MHTESFNANVMYGLFIYVYEYVYQWRVRIMNDIIIFIQTSNLPWYSRNIANVGIKHQSIN